MCVCSVSVDELYPGRPYGALDSGFNSVDSGDKRWSGNEVRHTHTHAQHVLSYASCLCVSFLPVCVCVQPTEELSELPLRVAEISRDQRNRGGGGGALLANGTREFILATSEPGRVSQSRSENGFLSCVHRLFSVGLLHLTACINISS